MQRGLGEVEASRLGDYLDGQVKDEGRGVKAIPRATGSGSRLGEPLEDTPILLDRPANRGLELRVRLPCGALEHRVAHELL